MKNSFKIMFKEYIKLKPIEIQQSISEFPAAYIPIGALEWHSYHLPLGFDGLKAEFLLRKVCEKINKGILFPTLYFGAYDTMNFPWTFHFSKQCLRKQIKAFVKQLYKIGFKVIVLLTGHYPLSHVKHLKNIAKRFMKKHKDSYIIAIPEQYLLHDLNYFGDHAAHWETNLGLALMPELVDLNQLPLLPNYITRLESYGIMGNDPKVHSNEEDGKKMVSLFVERMVEIIEKCWINKMQKPIFEIYFNFDKAMKKLRNPKNLMNTINILGMSSRTDLFAYLKWIIRGKKYKKI